MADGNETNTPQGKPKAPWEVGARSGEWTIALSRWLRDLAPWASMLGILAGAAVILLKGVQGSMSEIASYVRNQDPNKREQ